MKNKGDGETPAFADGQCADSKPRPGITWLGIPTRNRPEQLSRCIGSFAGCVSRHERDVRFLVVDQTDDGSQLQLNRQAVA
ncbi:MAG TPA: hypothetical protein V6C72_15875, partial [Chroococcales cyanobacterium]